MSEKIYRDIIARIKISKGEACGIPIFNTGSNRDAVILENYTHKEGSIVRIDIDSAGKVTAVYLLAEPGTAQSKIYDVLEKFKINPSFPIKCHEEVASILENPGIDDPLLVDFTCLPFVTIDNEGSRDLDQAVYISKENGTYTVYYALADASFYVKPGMALFDESVKRGASYYLPGLSVPMLPGELSEGIVSLNPDSDRRAVVFILKADKNGEALTTEIVRGRIRSRAKLTYNGVQEYYDEGGLHLISGKEFSRSLDLLKEIGNILIRNTIEREVVQYHRSEENITFSSDNMEFIVSLVSRNDCSRYNEQMSLLCNIEGAKLFSGSPGVQSIFRIHDAPTEESMLRLKTVIREIAKEQGLDAGVWYWDNEKESLADYLERIFSRGNNSDACDAIERQILISNERSFFDDNESGHYALGVSLYSRFSSPMREIIGIFTHKEMMEKLGLAAKEFSDEEDEIIRDSVIKSGNRSKDIQKQLDKGVKKLVVDQIFNGELNVSFEKRKIHTGTILGIKSSRLYVMLHDIPVEVKVYVEEIEEHSGMKLEYSKDAVFIESDDKKFRYTIGDMIKLKVYSYSERGKWILLPLKLQA